MDSFPEDLGVKVIHDGGRVAGAGLMSHRLDVSAGGEQQMTDSSSWGRLRCATPRAACMSAPSPQTTPDCVQDRGRWSSLCPSSDRTAVRILNTIISYWHLIVLSLSAQSKK